MQIHSRSITYRLLKRVDLSIVLSQYNKGDAEKLFARRIAVVGNGIPDPCPQFAAAVMPRRRARLAARVKLLAGQQLDLAERAEAGGDPQVFKVLFLLRTARAKRASSTPWMPWPWPTARSGPPAAPLAGTYRRGRFYRPRGTGRIR